MFYLNIIRYFISPNYFSGLKVVPLIMLGELFFGIFYNLSVWYKLTDRTIWGMWFSLFGLAVTVVLNIILVPRIGYMGCAVATLCSYGSMMIASYFIGLKKYPIGYQTGRILAYFGIAAALYGIGLYALPLLNLGAIAEGIIRFGLLAIFVYIFVKVEKINLTSEFKSILHRR